MARKFLTDLNLAQNSLLNAVIQPLAAAPGSPVAGQVYFDTTLHQYGVYNGTAWVYLGSGSGTVTSVSVVTANGLAGSVSNPTTTPAITVSTNVTGLLKGNGTAIGAASSGVDYAPATSGSAALKGNGSGGFGAAVLNDVAAATGDYSLNSHKITSLATPTAATDAATKGYVDTVAQGLSGKYSATAATTGAETYTVSGGSVTQIAGTTVDGQSPSVNDYVLVKDAPAATGAGSAGSSQPGNGLYQVTSATTNLSLSRAAVMSGTNPPAGAYVFTEGGTANASAGYVVSTPSTSAAFTYGTNNIQFTQFSGAGEITAGTGLSKSGNTLSLATLKGKFTATVGDGASTSITVTHSLGTRDVTVQIYDASTFAQYDCDVTRTSTSAVTLGFTTAPTSSSINVVVIG